MKKSRSVILTSFLAIIILLFSGACTSKSNETKGPDVKNLLSQAAQGLEKIEQENLSLKKTLATTKKGRLSLDTKSLKDELEKAKKENEVLQKALDTLKGQYANTKQQLVVQGAASARVVELEQNSSNLEKEVSKLKGMLSFSRIQLEVKENESKKLSTILGKITAITNAQNTEMPTTPVP